MFGASKPVLTRPQHDGPRAFNQVTLSYLEIYNDNLRDLLGPKEGGKDAAGKEKKKVNLDVRSLPGEPVSVPGLAVLAVRSCVCRLAFGSDEM